MTDDKITRFERLYQLDDFPEDHIEDTSSAEIALNRSTRMAPVSKPSNAASSSVRRRPEFEVVGLTSFSNPPPEVKKKPANTVMAENSSGKTKDVQPKRKRSRKVRSPQPKYIDPIVAIMTGVTNNPLPVKGKGKKEPPLKMVPESRQIFKGLRFFFVPNSDVNGARKMRIRKAMEYGAIWEKEWTGEITHVIVDRGYTRQDLLEWLKIRSLPDNVVLVNDIYTIDCASKFGFLVEPNQPLYRVDPGLDPALVTPSNSQSSVDQSLQVKPAKRETGKLLETPSRNESISSGRVVLQPRGDSHNSPSPSERRIPSPAVDRKHKNALDEAIEEACKFRHLPIDLDDEEDDPPTRAEQHDTEDEGDIENPAKRRKKDTKDNGFQCMQKHDGRDRDNNPNATTIETLQKMADYYSRVQDTWRPIAYRKAIASLRKQTIKVVSAEEAAKLPFVGKSLAFKIEEIACTNRLRRLESTKLDPRDQLLDLFSGIYGVGNKQASKWIDQGYQSLEDLRTKAKLTTNQKVGIDHYDDFKSRIPRAEVEEHGNIVRHTAHAIDPLLQVTIMGSYRRGTETCGDIDFLITKENAPIHELRNIFIEELVPALFEQDFLQVGLAVMSKSTGTKWHGASRIPGRVGTPWRRIDFLLVPSNEVGAALLYFTGNDVFNRSIRLLASKKGMRLSQRGLWTDVFRGHNRQKLDEGTLIESRSESRIFELLGVPYRAPEHRNC